MTTKIHYFFITLTVFILGGIARSNTITWTNTAGGNWNTAANWSPNQVPVSTNDVAITTSGTYLVTLNTSPTINSLTLGAGSGQQTLNTGNNTLTLNNASLVDTNGILGLNGGTLANGGLLTVNGQINWTSGTFNPGGGVTFSTSGTLTLAGVNGTDYTVAELMTNAGDIVIQSGNLSLNGCGSDSGGLFNLPGALVDIQADCSIDQACAGTVVNQGTVQKSGGTGTTAINAVFDNTGTLAVLTGTVTLTGGGILNSNATVAAGTELNLAGGNYTGTAFNVAVAAGGQLDFNGPTLSGAVNPSGPGTVIFNNGTLTLDPAAPLPALVVTNGTLTLNGSVTNLLLGGGDLVGTITVYGTMTWTNGTIGPSGDTLTIATNASLVLAGVNGTDYTMSQPITNAGDIMIQSGNLALQSCSSSDGVLFNVRGALLDIQADCSIDSACGGAIFNQGTVQKSGGTNTSAIHVTFDNTGTLAVLTGTVTLTGGGILNSNATVAAGTELNFAGGNYTGTAFNVAVAAGAQLDFNGPTLSGTVNPSGPGTVIFNSGTLTLDPTTPLPGLVMTNGTLTLNGSVTNLLLGGGDLVGTITVYGTMTWTNGTIGPSGDTLTIATNASLVFAGVNGTDYTMSQPITNAGDIMIQSGNLALQSCSSSDGVLFNVRGALLDIQADCSIDSACGGAIFNQGTVRKSGGTNTSAIHVTFNNTGTLDAQSGTIGLAGTYNLTGGTLNIGITSPTNFALINLTNAAALTGTLSLQFEDGFLPVLGDSFPVLTYGSRSGSFTNFNLPSRRAWQMNYGATVLTLTDLNDRPTLAPVTGGAVDELTPFTTTAGATDPDAGQTLTYSLVSPPNNMTINPSTGVISWTPGQTQSPSTNSVTVIATDNGTPPLSDTNSFTVIVVEVNVAPVLPFITPKTIYATNPLTVTNTAAEANIHATVTYSLVNPPTGMTISPNGVITWTPTPAQGLSTNAIVTVATSSDPLDGINPFLTATNFFTVADTATVLTSPTVLANGDFEFSFDTLSNSSYTIEYSTNLIIWSPVFGFVGDGNPITLYTPTTGSGPRVFYRVLLAP